VIFDDLTGWLIQPRKQRGFEFAPALPTQTREMGESLDAGDELPGFELSLEEMFGWLGKA
jgi:hypothetical protein